MDLTYGESSCLVRFTDIFEYRVIDASFVLFRLSINSQVKYEFDVFVMRIWVHFRGVCGIFEWTRHYPWLTNFNIKKKKKKKKKKKIFLETKKMSQRSKDDEICDTRLRYS